MSNRDRDRDRNGPPRERINGAIRVREVRLIGDDGAQLGVMPTAEALRRAQEANVDLVEVQPGADPPVCKLMDYGRMRYDRDRKERENKRVQKIVELKELRLNPDTDQHDLDTKRKRLHGWLGEGNKVQLTVRMRGREQAHPDVARKVLADMAATVTDVGHIERDVLPEGRTITMIMAPGPAPVRRQPNAPRPASAPAPVPASAPAPVPASAPAPVPASAPDQGSS